jgi:hypothetical protein
MRVALLFAGIGLICTACLPAQPTSLSGPVEAITFDAPTRSIRAVIGFPGTASFGPALLDNLELASVAPGQNYGIVFEAGKCLLVSGLASKKISTAAIAGVTEHPDGIAWSANASLAILYSRAGNWFQIIAGFPNAPVADALTDLSSLGGSLAAVAADTSGQQVAVAIGGDKGGVYEAQGNLVTPLASMQNPVSLSFSSDGKTLYALDSATQQVTAITLGNHGLETLPLSGIANPVAIRSLQDSQNRPVLYVAGGNDRILRILDVTSQQTIADVALNFQPTSIDPFGSSSFVLAPRSQTAKPLWVFSSTPQPAAYFVPAIQMRQPVHRSVSVGGRSR